MAALATASPLPSAPERQGFVPLAAGILPCLKTAKYDLFFWNTNADRAVLFREADTPLEESRIGELVEKCGDYLFVRNSDFQGLCDYMLARLEEVARDEKVPPVERFGLLQTVLSFEVERCLAVKDNTDYLQLVSRVGKLIRNLVGENVILTSRLFSIARHDAATYAHVTNVAAYASVLAKWLGITDVKDVDEIVTGAMLHDIGKRFISKRILTKAKQLTSEERAIIRSHPQFGYEELAESKDVTHAERMVVYQHHEHVDGTGYPVRILGDEIHPWAKLVAVVDVFDALTGRRPYRRPMSMSEAAEFISDRAGTHFDREMAQCWVSAIQAR